MIIEIPDEEYQKIKETNMVISGRRSGKRFDYILFNAINTGTPIPKGHGRIIDESKIILPFLESETDEKWVEIGINNAPTIIEADSEEGSMREQWIIEAEPSLDGVIKKYTEVTNRWIREAEKSSKKNDREEVDICLFHSVENHQITKWLTELKELRRWKEGLKPRYLASEWIIDEREDDRILKCHCAYCGQDPQIWIGGTENWWVRTLPDFCPNCGASMTRKMPKDIKEDD